VGAIEARRLNLVTGVRELGHHFGSRFDSVTNWSAIGVVGAGSTFHGGRMGDEERRHHDVVSR
jgi:hypothetical protein